MAWANPNTPNLPDFRLFIADVMKLGPGLVPADSLFPQYALNKAMRLVIVVPGICGPDYTDAVYNCAGHILLTIMPAQPGTPVMSALRGKYHLMDPNLGIVTASADQGTSNSLAVPEVLQNLTVGDLQFIQTPWGRAYLAYANDFGGIWGVELMPTLRLGVLDVPYEKHVPEELKRVRVRTKKGDKPHRAPAASPAGGKTTGDVAEILEAEYHVMEIFFEEHQQQIAGALEETMGDMFEDMLSGAPSPMGTNSMVAATSSIETMFRQWIDRKGMDGLQPGVPTKASLKGVNHRLKHPFAKNNPVRPSFKDTGAYEQSFRAEIDLES